MQSERHPPVLFIINALHYQAKSIASKPPMMGRRSFGSGRGGLSQETLNIVIVFISLSIYNAIELLCITLATFKRYSGVYFWSFIISTLGILLNSVAFIPKFWGPAPLSLFTCTMIVTGWSCMVTGQSMVLWSRLHLVLYNQRHINMILWMIVINAILCHGTIIPLAYGSFSSHPTNFLTPYSIAEKIEIVVFFIQETLLSSIYIIETVKLMRLERAIGNTRTSRRLMKHLILVNVIIILLDATVLGLEFANQYEFQISWKPFAYSVKLKLEFTILNRLVEMTSKRKDASFNFTTQDSNTLTTTKTGITLAETCSKPSPASGGSDQEHTETNYQEKASPAEDDSGLMMTPGIFHGKEIHDNDKRNVFRCSSTDCTIGMARAANREHMWKSSSAVHLATQV